jgi:hypothetical protein
MLMFYLSDYLTFVQTPNKEVEQLIKKERNYTKKELIERAAEKLADIFVRFMDSYHKK